MKSFYEQFMQTNRFCDGMSIFRQLESTALRHIVYAIGLMKLIPANHVQRQSAIHEALEAYRMSCTTLRMQLETASVADHIASIETTILMGFFEVTCLCAILAEIDH